MSFGHEGIRKRNQREKQTTKPDGKIFERKEMGLTQIKCSRNEELNPTIHRGNHFEFKSNSNFLFMKTLLLVYYNVEMKIDETLQGRKHNPNCACYLVMKQVINPGAVGKISLRLEILLEDILCLF